MHYLYNIIAYTQVSLIVFTTIIFESKAQSARDVQWPSTSRESKPCTRWWWHGSAVTKAGITAELEKYKAAGLGGVEITPIYGVHGQEEQFINYLSPQWVELLQHVLREGERLDMGIDMATGTGWPFGGPWVKDVDACKNLEFKTYNVKAGERLKEKIYFVQEPYLRAVGNQVYEVHDSTIAGERARGTIKEPLMAGKGQLTIEQLVQPVEANKNLQALALDQVKFERSLPLQALMAYNDRGASVDLFDKVDSLGMLQWTAPQGNWKLYAVFAGSHGKMVERAGPGGEGNVIDHFSAIALTNYLTRFDKALVGVDMKSLRAFFNDSYEVDDARGTADYTPLLFKEFLIRRGYDLRMHLPALFGEDTPEKNQRILCDYRETISELILENFTQPWKSWADGYQAVVRNQAHGSPANILDLYATVDIPEIEGIEPLRIKMASSAGNVTGKKLVSSESATWLNEHFQSNLLDIKKALDRFFVHGVNHIFYHGTTYSPADAPWPGWLFYAAVHLNPRNSLWPHFHALNKYVERTQTFLQSSTADNDILLYYPVFERFSTPGREMIEHFDGVGVQFEGTVFKETADWMLMQGYAFDYVSDKQIGHTKVVDGQLISEGNARYKTLIVPHCKFIPLRTIEKIFALAEAGATIIFAGGLPVDISGFKDAAVNKIRYEELIGNLSKASHDSCTEMRHGKGRILVGGHAKKGLSLAAVRRETMVEQDLQFIRKNSRDGVIYFISNGSKALEGWIALETPGKTVILYNPMTGESGEAEVRRNKENVQVHLSLHPHETLVVQVKSDEMKLPAYPVNLPVGKPLLLTGPWSVSFPEGGPELSQLTLVSIQPWTSVKDSGYASFSGTGSYRIDFKLSKKQRATGYLLDLGDVRESAEVIINGKSLGVLIGPDFKIYIDAVFLDDENVLEIRVCNLMANRISFLDKHHVFWKKFYNINFPARKAENRKNNLFDASQWSPAVSGIIGPVKLIEVLDTR